MVPSGWSAFCEVQLLGMERRAMEVETREVYRLRLSGIHCLVSLEMSNYCLVEYSFLCY